MSTGGAESLASIAWAALAQGIRLRETLAAACLDEIVAGARLLANSLARGGKVILFGNGGSAADAQHISAELVGRYSDERPALPALALTVDSSALTAIANDYGFERVFARQLEALARPGDVAVAISTSGRSPNVLAGVATARARGAAVIGLTGAEGAALRQSCDLCVAVPSRVAARIQECHIAIGHVWCELIDAIGRSADRAPRPARAGKVVELDELVRIALHVRRAGQTIVWTNGCFDILHAGHLASLRRARELGDWLVVGLNSDASVRRLKGPERPIFPAAHRAELLAGLAVTDLVTIFDGDTPEECIARLRPDVCCKGSDYDPARGGLPAPERRVVDGYGGRMVYLPLVPGLSTTGAAAALAPRER